MEKIPTVLYEDTNILVIDKPYGITVNRSETTIHEQTVQDWVESYLSIKKHQAKEIEESDFSKRAGIVHRLDKETSGILIIAKTKEAFENLQKQFKERLVKKTYIAFSHGRIVPPDGIINVPVGRLPWNRMRFGVVAGGRESLTKYHVLKYYEVAKQKEKEIGSLVELNPQTGRTHQIRVHLKHINHPIFSDYLYAGRKTSRDDRTLLSRVFLHAQKISFINPMDGGKTDIESPLPKELQEFLSLYCVEV